MTTIWKAIIAILLFWIWLGSLQMYDLIKVEKAPMECIIYPTELLAPVKMICQKINLNTQTPS